MALRVRQIGLRGVNAVDSPLHLHDEDLTHAQNAQSSFADGFPALVKRPGLASFASGLTDPVLGLSSVPLPDPDAETDYTGLIVFHNAADSRRSTDGSIWGTVTLPDVESSAQTVTWPTFQRQIHYPGQNIVGEIYATDGSSASLVHTLPSHPVLGDGASWTLDNCRLMASDGTFLYVVGEYSRLSYLAYIVWRLDTQYNRTQLGQTFASHSIPGRIEEAVYWITTWLGEVFVLTSTYTGWRPLRVRRISPTGSAWTLDDDFGGSDNTSTYRPTFMLARGNRALVAARTSTPGVDPTLPILRTRTSEGAWSTLEQGAHEADRYHLLAVSSGEAIVARLDGVLTETAIRRTTDWSSWTTVAGPSNSLAGDWWQALKLGGHRYAVRHGGAVTVERVESTGVTTVVSLSTFPSGFGGWL